MDRDEIMLKVLAELAKQTELLKQANEWLRMVVLREAPKSGAH
jgi:hypothetical protein